MLFYREIGRSIKSVDFYATIYASVEHLKRLETYQRYLNAKTISRRILQKNILPGVIIIKVYHQ